MHTLLKWFIGLVLTLLGCFFYLGAQLIGGGVHLGPQPGPGILFAVGAFGVTMGGYCALRSEKRADILANIINVVLILGTISLVVGVAEWGYEIVYPVGSSDWGYSQPGEVLFRVSYGALSVVGLVFFNKLVRKKQNKIKIVQTE